MNHVTLIGRLTKDPEIYNNVSKFTLAVDRGYKDGQDMGSDFIRCAAFGNISSVVEKHLHKASRIAIEGRIQTGSYESEGKKIYTTDVIVRNVTFLDSKKKEHQEEGEFTAINEEVPF